MLSTIGSLAVWVGLIIIIKQHYNEIRRQIKRLIAIIYLCLKKQQPLFNFNADSQDLGQLGIKALPEATLRENPRELNPHINAVDGIRMWGANKNGAFVYVNLSRRHGRVSEVQVYFRSTKGQVYELPAAPDSNIFNTDGKTFSAAGLTFEVLEPLRRWRVNYKGLLRHVEDGRLVEANLNFLWIPASCYVSFPEDFNHTYLADFYSKEMADLCFVKFLKSMGNLESHENSGQLHGVVKIDEESEEILIRGFKIRSNGIMNWNLVNRKMSIETFMHNGGAVRLFIDKMEGQNKLFIYGYVLPPCNLKVLHFGHCEENADIIQKVAEKNRAFEVNFTAGGFKFNLKMELKSDFKCFHGTQFESKSVLSLCKATLNDIDGDGIVEVVSSFDENCDLFKDAKSIARKVSKLPFHKISLPLLTEPAIKVCDQLVVAFTDTECSSSAIVGGKAASLSLMSAVTENSNLGFSVPHGVSVTRTAWDFQELHNPKIKSAISDLIHSSRAQNKNTGDIIKVQCECLVELISSTPVSQKLKDELEIGLKEVFGDNFEDLKFAVRSSAIGEDGEEMSAAGQNETYLGVKGFEQLCAMINKCWASQFAFRSVEYKRQNGQLLNGGMGVVIQQMVPAEVAGVLFSRHPLTGSSSQLYITANYGLGESVVSASADPDTVIIARSYDDQLNIHQINVGSKQTSIVMSEVNGTMEMVTTTEESSKCSLTNDQALRLASIAIYLEKCFGNGRDIEWAINNEQIYILQSRPVTTNSSMTDFEILHEFNSLSRTDEESYTTANASEVLPGCVSPLTYTSCFRAQIPYFMKSMSWRINVYKYDPIVLEWMASFYGHAMFDLINMKAWNQNTKKDAISKAFDVGIHGKVLDEEDTMKVALDRYKLIRPPLKQQFSMMATATIKGMLFGSRLIKNGKKKFENFRLPIEGTEDKWEVYKIIENHFTASLEVYDTHLPVSFASSLWNVILLKILSSGAEEFTADHYADFATLIGSCNGAESGNVPASIAEMVTAISSSHFHEHFIELSPQVALDSLINSEDVKVKQLFLNFLQRHGHRGIKEVDLYGKPWGREPHQIISILQEMYKTPTPPAKNIQNQDVIEKLKTPLTSWRKRILRWVLSSCRRSVLHREAAKSLLVKSFHGFREAYYHLADMLVKEGYLIDTNLLFFFTHEEIAEFMSTRSPKILRRAKHRQRLYDYKDKLKFPSVIKGFPRPLNDDDSKLATVDYNTIVKGFPVSQGIIEGPVRVVKSFHEVNTIQAGEILITHATDIGWSPYFPLISGIVTEIGGLISHGAVVAREFGLPCIVAVENATKLFHSGDLVRLNAIEGTIMKLELQSPSVI